MEFDEHSLKEGMRFLQILVYMTFLTHFSVWHKSYKEIRKRLEQVTPII